jgi:hypothetical protein
MSRCKSCNSVMSDEDMLRKFPDGSFSDLCGDCHEESVNVIYDNYTEPEEYNEHTLYASHSLSDLSPEW